MLSKTWWLLSFRWLFWNKNAKNQVLESTHLSGAAIWIAIISFVLGIGSLSFVRALVTGFERQLSLGVAQFFAPLSYKSGWKSQGEHRRLVDALGDMRVESYWQGQALLVGPKGGRGVLVEGRKEWKNKLMPSSECQKSLSVHLTMGKALADYLGASSDKPLKLLLPGIIKGSVRAEVTRIQNFGLQEIDARRVIIDNDSLDCFLAAHPLQIGSAERPGDFIGLRFYPPIDPLDDSVLASTAQRLEGEITKQMRDSEPHVKTWKQQRQNFFKGLGFDRAVLSVVLGFLTLAASLNVAAALFVLFFERDREMLTLRALGMSPRQMCSWVMIQGFMIGTLGTLLGFAGSWATAKILEKSRFIKLPAEVYNLDHLVFSFEWNDQVGVLGYGLLVSLLVSGAVGYLLSRMKIMEVLSHRR